MLYPLNYFTDFFGDVTPTWVFFIMPYLEKFQIHLLITSAVYPHIPSDHLYYLEYQSQGSFFRDPTPI